MKQPQKKTSQNGHSNGNGNGNGHSHAIPTDREAVLQPVQQSTLRQVLQPLASLRLTVILLALSMVLIFAGTTIQTEMGIWDVQRRYFHSWVTLIEWRLFFPLWEWGRHSIPGAIPFPGGYTLILFLLLNLLAAHSIRFKLNWKRSGIFLIHVGMILLLVGEVVTAEKAVESQMLINVGGSADYASDIRTVELAVTDTSPADHDDEVIIPHARLKDGATIQTPKLPFALRIESFYENSDVLGPNQAGTKKNIRATAGSGKDEQLTVLPQPKLSGTEMGLHDIPSSFVTLLSGEQELGSYLFSTFFAEPQTVNIDGKEYLIELRWQRHYKPYKLELLEFTHDKYQGTNKPKNFASRVRLTDPAKGVDREVLIWMNHPMSYAGETFYQSGFDPKADRYTVLQVVRNPGWLIPYVSCSMVGLGLLVHFGMHLIGFLKRHAGTEQSAAKRRPGSSLKPSWIPAATIVVICVIYLLKAAFYVPQPTSLEMSQFARVPVSYEGRTMPLDSLARNSVRILSGKSEITLADGGKMPAIDWLLEVFGDADRTMDYKVFYIDHPEVLGLLGLKESWLRTSSIRSLIGMDERERFAPSSFLSSKESMEKLQAQYKLAFAVDPKKRDLYQRKIMDLAGQIMLFGKLRGVATLYLSPPLENPEWRPLGDVMQEAQSKNTRDPGTEAFVGMLEAYGEGKAAEFNLLGAEYHKLLEQKMPDTASRLDLEVMFNRFEPFIKCMALYVMVFVLAAVSWLKWHAPLARAALWLLILTAAVHTFGLIARIYIQGRPPVTNLYSSAIFIAWGAVIFCVALELIYKNAIASAVGAAVAFPSLLIAHYLAGSGDTMQMLEAVLDTNIWLATHVVVVTLGYTAAFLSGFLAIAYIIGGVMVPSFNADMRKTMYRMIYGIVCFAMLFSFVGTILGGIWADQSWGRFWGWDPKENGAVLIVLWNAIILHARWGGLVRERGFANLAVLGNIVTAWSWFGTNMLGVGLHSYGFMDSAAFWLVAFVALQVGIVAVGSLPLRLWRSFNTASGFVPKPA